VRPALLLVLLATVALAAEGLPKGFEPGLRAEFARSGTGERLRGSVVLTVEKGETEGTVRVVREFRTDTTGPLAMRERLVAVVEKKSRRVLSFTYEIGKAKGDLVLASRCGPDPERDGKLLHERFTYTRKDEPSVTKYRPRPAGAWVPDLLEPYLAGLLSPTTEQPAEVWVMDTLKGRVLKSPARYRLLGEGAKKLGGKDVSCRILLRTRAKEKGKSYLSAEDALPLTDTTYRIERKALGKEKDR
jgi:hypothetical protein